MKKTRISDFEKMCKSLDEWGESSNGKEIELAKTAVEGYVGTEYDRLLKLKAEAQRGDYQLYLSQNLSQTAMLLALMAIIIDIASANSLMIESLLYLCITGALVIYICWWTNKYQYVNYWRYYIIIVIEEIEKSQVQLKGKKKKKCKRCKIG